MMMWCSTYQITDLFYSLQKKWTSSHEKKGESQNHVLAYLLQKVFVQIEKL